MSHYALKEEDDKPEPPGHISDHPATHSKPTASNAPVNRKKRRASSAAGGAPSSGSSRGVANLTPEQLAKKRANDREAQRAIRERTKAQIETLERRIEELTSQDPHRDLQEAIRAKELVEAENEDIKRRLAQVLSIIQPLLGNRAFDGECLGYLSVYCDRVRSRYHSSEDYLRVKITADDGDNSQLRPPHPLSRLLCLVRDQAPRSTR